MKAAYCSLLAHGDGYMPGVEALGQSLDASGSTIPRVLMVTGDISAPARRSLGRGGWDVREVAPISNPSADPLFRRFESVYTKLRAWELEGIDKAVFLDADTLVLRNIDDLFERPSFAAAPDFLLPDHFNSGVMVLHPSKETFAAMLDALRRQPSYDGGDQGFLNAFFSEWWALSPEHRLPATFNIPHFIYQFMHAHPRLSPYLGEVRVIHYMVQKPWRDLPVPLLTGGAEVWWASYLTSHPERSNGWARRLRALQDWSFDHAIRALVR